MWLEARTSVRKASTGLLSKLSPHFSSCEIYAALGARSDKPVEGSSMPLSASIVAEHGIALAAVAMGVGGVMARVAWGWLVPV